MELSSLIINIKFNTVNLNKKYYKNIHINTLVHKLMLKTIKDKLKNDLDYKRYL